MMEGNGTSHMYNTDSQSVIAQSQKSLLHYNLYEYIDVFQVFICGLFSFNQRGKFK